MNRCGDGLELRVQRLRLLHGVPDALDEFEPREARVVIAARHGALLVHLVALQSHAVQVVLPCGLGGDFDVPADCCLGEHLADMNGLVRSCRKHLRQLRRLRSTVRSTCTIGEGALGRNLGEL